MKRAVCFLGLLSFSFCWVASRSQGETPLPEGWVCKWTLELKEGAMAPTWFPDADHPTGVVMTSSSGVVLVDSKGTVLWSYAPDLPPASPAAVGDLDHDGLSEIVVYYGQGGLLCLNQDGTPRWQRVFGKPGSGFTAPVIADVHPSEGEEVLVGFDDGWLRCLSATGDVLWEFFGDRFRVGGVAVGDVDADGDAEIVYGTDNGHVYCVNGWGQIEWRFNELAPYGRSGVNLADLNTDGVPEVLITRSNVNNNTCLIALDGRNGTLLWRTRDVMQGYVSNAVVDLTGTNQWVVFHGDKGNNLYCENADGTRRWHAVLNGRGIFWAPAVADVDGDGHLEIIVGVRGEDPETGACVFVVGDDGTVKERLDLGNDANAGPAAGDLDGDGCVDLVLVSQNPNRVQCLSRNAKGRVGWASLRGNARMTGCAPNVSSGKPAAKPTAEPIGTASLDFDSVYLGENVWKISWNRPAADGACIEIASAGEKGRVRTYVFDIREGSQNFEAHWDILQPGLTSVSVRMLEGSTPTATFAVHRTVQPMEAEFCDYYQVSATCQDAIEAGAAVGADTQLIRARLSALEAARQAVASMSKASDVSPESLANAATNLRRQSAQLASLARTLRAFWREGGTGNFVCWVDENPWDDFDPLALPGKLEMDKPAVVKAFKNEYEDLAVTLFNISSETIDVRCTLAPPDPAGKSWYQPEPPETRAITLRRLLPVGSAWKDRVFDPLPELDLSRSITIPPGEARQIWAVVKTHDMAPGKHEFKLYLGSLTKPPKFRELPIEVEVWPVSLPTDVFAKINWSNLDYASVSDQALDYMMQMGLNVSYGPNLPAIPVDSEGNLAGAVDWSSVDKILDRVPRYWTFLWSAPPPRKWPEGVNPTEDSPQYFNGFRTAIRELANHLKTKGIDYYHWAFYPMDEPWNTGFTGIPELKTFCERVKRADPNAQVYADPCGLVRVEYLQEFKGLIDIWQPELNVLKRDPQLVQWFRENAKRFWFYEAPGPAKSLLPLGHYRAFGWYAWHFGTEGCGYWVYKANDDWFYLDSDYSVVYQTNTDTVASRRSEADRDGVEDYRAFYVLQKEIDAARAAGNTDAAEAAAALLREAVETVIGWNLRNIDEITRATRDYEISLEHIQHYRERIKEEILKLRQKDSR